MNVISDLHEGFVSLCDDKAKEKLACLRADDLEDFKTAFHALSTFPGVLVVFKGPGFLLDTLPLSIKVFTHSTIIELRPGKGPLEQC